MRYAYPNELYHYGIIGMKWGVRRYQNPDGTLTAAGRRRYGSIENLAGGVTKKQIRQNERALNKATKAALAGDTKKVMKLQKKLSDEDVNKVINRANLAKRLSDISDAQVKTGTQKVAEFAKTIGTISDAVQKSASLYDNVAKVANAFGADLPRIEGNKEGNKEGKQKGQSFSKEFENLLRTKDVSWFAENADKFTSAEIKEVNARYGQKEELLGKAKRDSEKSSKESKKGKK